MDELALETRIRAQVREVQRRLTAFQDNLAQGTGSTAGDLARVKAALVELEQMTPGAASPMDIKDFFATVGDGVIAAQQTLDQKSLEYITTRPDAALASLFRIPKASAEIQFAIETREDQRFSVVVYGSGDSRQQSQQHKVAFDIVAAPLPPDMLAAVDRLSLKVHEAFVASVEERRRIQQILTAYAQRHTGPARDKVEALARDDTFRSTIALRGADYWSLLLPVADADSVRLDVMYASYDGRDVIVFAGEAPKQFPQRYGRLFRLLRDLSARQADQLTTRQQRSSPGT